MFPWRPISPRLPALDAHPREVPKLDRQFHDLMGYVLDCERWERVQDRIDGRARLQNSHRCHPPQDSLLASWRCDCGQSWRRELGGGWLPE